MLQQDTLFANRYQLRSLIGRGGFSAVWLAHDTWADLCIFMPYKQLHFAKFSLSNEPLRLDLGIWDNAEWKLIDNIKYLILLQHIN